MLLVQVNVDPARKAARCHRQLDYCISRACIDCNKEQPHATLHQQHEHPDKQEKNVVHEEGGEQEYRHSENESAEQKLVCVGLARVDAVAQHVALLAAKQLPQ